MKRNTTTPLSPVYRAETLRKLAREEVDVLVVGGGVTGAGVALDAASRGLSVALVEARDFAAGTSSRSSKLIHGGLRYLEQLDFKLVREALKERGLLLQTLAPHLVRPVKFLVPLTHRVWERGYIGAACHAVRHARRGPRAAAAPAPVQARRVQGGSRPWPTTPWSARSSTTTPRSTTRATR